ncbi:ElyC/SanA/YdcF family protein [Opitutus sp. ER46]|uniref:YdcF family protein n=1 Tax=Opitutus sp. ER46 TaxID=2161864 RepID=UPI000D31A259|nr:ElyC/SanA/YdcF family protein [Opitutus sp. ER46]PTY01107.1 hypothetical protein DB354_00820 [Opitutus sp. ER46]
MFFWLKKVIAYVLMPIPACFALLGVGVALLWTRRGARAGRMILTVAVLLLLVLGNGFVSTWLIRPLETQYPAAPDVTAGAAIPPALASCQFVIVLGGGNLDLADVPALTRLSGSAFQRLTEAVRLLRFLPHARLVVSGPADPRLPDRPTHATMLERAAISLGVDPGRIVRIEHARDTEDESRAVRKLAGPAPVALVTSAWHMPRSMALFRSAGVNAIACPTDYKMASYNDFHWRDCLWNVDSLERSTLAVRERIGHLWIWLRGKAG